MQRKKAFTLVEILIVVIILGILAAIVIPQFTEASNDARKSQLVSDLQTLRSQIELYKVQHLERLPSKDKNGVADTSVTNFVDRLTKKTHHTGELNTGGKYGPYLHKFPTNPFATSGNSVLFGIIDAAGDDASGWWFNTTTGRISPNDSAANAAL